MMARACCPRAVHVGSAAVPGGGLASRRAASPLSRRVSGGGGYTPFKSLLGKNTTKSSSPSAGVRVVVASLPDQGLPKGVKPPRPPPTWVHPPLPPPSVDTWQNMVLLMDKPKGWTSFDVVGRGETGTKGKTFAKEKEGKLKPPPRKHPCDPSRPLFS